MDVRILKNGEIKKMSPYIPDLTIRDDSVVIGCYEEYEPLGVMIINPSGEVGEIVWIYVGEQHRDQGVARSMVEFAKDWADEHNTILTGSFQTDANLRHLMVMAGFELEVDVLPEYAMSIEALDRVFEKYNQRTVSYTESKYTQPLSEMTPDQLNEFVSHVCDGEKMDEEEFINNFLLGADPKLSRFMVKKNKIVAAIFVTKVSRDIAQVSYLWNDAQQDSAIGHLMLEAYAEAVDEGREINAITFQAVYPGVEKMARESLKLTPVREIEIITAVYYCNEAERKEK